METYIYKMIAISAIFILLYFVFRKKKNHFKRFYLLISFFFFSVLVPLISINYGFIEVVENINQNNAELMILPETKFVESSVFTTENMFG